MDISGQNEKLKSHVHLLYVIILLEEVSDWKNLRLKEIETMNKSLWKNEFWASGKFE